MGATLLGRVCWIGAGRFYSGSRVGRLVRPSLVLPPAAAAGHRYEKRVGLSVFATAADPVLDTVGQSRRQDALNLFFLIPSLVSRERPTMPPNRDSSSRLSKGDSP
ncbi:hypothetical protein V6N12_061128 [Hibiscus sabdariffa]|uniref:Uncharacterized protein n=1 Tax=Hibiscus sabdariffa TaxID=183260 RepID=A0ABR2DXT3_9ROSI